MWLYRAVPPTAPPPPRVSFCLGCFIVGAPHPDLVPFSKPPRSWRQLGHQAQSGPPDRHTHLASGYEGDRDAGLAAQGPSCSPSLHSRPPAGLRLDPETLATGREQGPVLGRACHPEPPPYRSLRGALPNWGAVVSFFTPFSFPFFLFFFVFVFACLLGCPQPESQDHRDCRGSREGGGVRWSVPDSTENTLSKAAPARAC